jgi:HK97 family phage portal protein
MGILQNLGQGILRRGLSRAFSAKASQVGPLIARLVAGNAVWSQRDFAQLAKEGYQQNAVVNACVGKIAEAVATIPICAYQKKGKNKVEIEDHPVLQLLKSPNPEQDWVSLMKAFVSHYKITGNGYLERTGEDDPAKMELYAWRPDRVSIVPREDGMVGGYEYRAGGGVKRVVVDPDRGTRPVLHMKTFNPTDDWLGMSPLDACAYAIDITNTAAKWNLGILNNSGAPSGAFIFQPKDGGDQSLSPDQIAQMRQQIDEMASAGGRHRPIVLDGGFDWKQMGLNPEQMQFVEGADRAAREIAFALGVPPMMLGIRGDNTYSNYQEARQAFYQDTVIPMARLIMHALTRWFERQLGENACLEVNTDQLEALAPMRKDLWQGLQSCTFLSINEKREAVGYTPVKGGDDVMVPAGLLPISMPDTIAGDNAAADPPPKKPGDKPPAKGGGLPYLLTGSVHKPSDVP